MQNDDYIFLYESLDKLYAYDTGATDSGVKNEELREKVIDCINNLSEEIFRFFLSEYVRDRFLSDKAISEGYGIEDVKEFIQWLDEYMNYVI